MSSKLPKQSGYVGLSMSIRATEAYENGEMPKSKWNKKGILSKIAETVGEKNSLKFKKDILLQVMLKYTGWHHTSYKMNETDFFAVDISLANMEQKLAQCEKASQDKISPLNLNS